MSDTQNRRLNPALLGQLPATVAVPRYDRSKIGQAIVHIGLGNFHRAHQALYLDDLFNTQGPGPWGICGVGLLPQDQAMAEALRPQDLLYTLVERDEGVETARVIGTQRGYLHAPSEPDAVIQRLADPETRIVSITVTEGGYYLDHGTGELDQNHPNLRHDLDKPGDAPVSLYGYLTEALNRRRKAGAAPFTVLSCDNLQSNGELAGRMLTAFSRLRDAELGRWIETNVTFPNCMVDRITPVTTDLHREQVKALLGGITDAWPVVAEPFRQWVVEDKFCNGRPDLAAVGVQMTPDVHPYELMKIHLLNAGHQMLCHYGVLLGYVTADEAMRDADIRALLNRYMDTVRPLIHEPPGVNLVEYQQTLISRFANPSVKDQLSRIAFYASSGIPKFVLPIAREQLKQGKPMAIFGLLIAGWIRYLGGTDDAGKPITPTDPLRDELQRQVQRGDADPTPFLGLHQIFGSDLPRAEPFVSAVRQALASLYANGTRATLKNYLKG